MLITHPQSISRIPFHLHTARTVASMPPSPIYHLAPLHTQPYMHHNYQQIQKRSSKAKKGKPSKAQERTKVLSIKFQTHPLDVNSKHGNDLEYLIACNDPSIPIRESTSRKKEKEKHKTKDTAALSKLPITTQKR